jgi:hypothetical protein
MSPDPVVSSMVFKQAKVKTLGTDPITPQLVAKWESDYEDKTDWTPMEAIKDAFRDGFKKGIKAFLDEFKYTTGSEMEEWAEWNPDMVLYEVRIPVKLLNKIVLKTITVGDVHGWIEKKLRDRQGG